jgi:hypothetical protein
MASPREPHRRRGSPLVSTSATPHCPHITACAFVHDHTAGFIELGWLTVALLGAVLWLALLVLTGFSTVVVSLGLLVCLAMTSSR